MSDTVSAGESAGGLTVAPVSADDHRQRLLDGLAAVVAEKGYAAATIADVVRHAHVSRRTFYEHFADKEECLLACYAAFSDDLLRAVVEAAAPDLPSQERIVAAVRAFLAELEGRPALARTHFMEMQAAGPRALQARRDMQRRFAGLLRDLAERGRARNPRIAALSPEMATAIVGGITELMLQAAEEGRLDRLTDLTETVSGLVRAVLFAPAE